MPAQHLEVRPRDDPEVAYLQSSFDLLTDLGHASLYIVLNTYSQDFYTIAADLALLYTRDASAHRLILCSTARKTIRSFSQFTQ